MSHVFVAVAALVTTTGSYEDIETDVETVVVSVRTDAAAAIADLEAWAKRRGPQDRTELCLSITESDPETGDIVRTTTFQAVPTVELAVTASAAR